MSEAVMWKYLKPKLEPHAEAIRLTDRHLKGLPDLLIARRKDKGELEVRPPRFINGRQTGLVEMKFIKEGAKKIGLRTDQALFAFNWAKVGYCGILVREGPDWWHFIHPQAAPAWISIVTGTKNAWRQCVFDCRHSFDVKTHGPDKLAPWLLQNLFDRV